MISKPIQTRTRTSDILGTWSLPSILSSDIDFLILIEASEWDVAGSTLSLRFQGLMFNWISLLDMPLHELGIF